MRPINRDEQPLSLFIAFDSLYQFLTDKFTRIPITSDLNSFKSQSQEFKVPKIKFVASLEGNLYCVNDTSRITIVGSISSPEDMAKKILTNREKEVYLTLDSLPSDQTSKIILLIFSYLWGGNSAYALQLITKYYFQEDFRLIVALFPSILLSAKPPSNQYIPSEPVYKYSNETSTYFHLLTDFLSSVRQYYIADHVPRESRKMIMLNTSLAQCFALFQRDSELRELIQNGDDVDLKILDKFLKQNTNLQSANAILFTQQGKIDQAIAIWKALFEKENKDKYLLELSYTLKKLSDSKSFIEYLDWLLEKNQKYAFEAIISTSHDVDSVLDWINNHKFTSLKLKYLNFLLLDKTFRLPINYVSDTFFEYITILNNPSLDKVEWTFSFQKNPNDLDSAIKEVLSNAIQCVEKNYDLISCDTALSKIEESVDKSLMFCLLKMNERYQQAISLILESSKEIPNPTVEQFCQTAPNPSKAFSEYFKCVSDEDFISPKFLTFLHNNLIYFDLIELF